MTATLKFRLAIFVLAIVSAVLVLFWTAHHSSHQAEELRERLTTVQLESFRIADRFQQSVQRLNNLLLRFAIRRQPDDLAQFEKQREELNTWIDQKKPELTSSREKSRLEEIDRAYDDYMAAAKQIIARVSTAPTGPSLADFSEFENQAERLLGLGFELADAHRESLDTFLRQTNRSLSNLQTLLLVALSGLLVLCAGLAVFVYRGMIAPLRVKLIETEALIERNEKLASLGLLAAGVAHEIRNPLTAIKARLFTLQKRLTPGSPNAADSEVISQEINRLERIVRDVLQFARPGDPQLATVGAEQPLHEVAALLRPELDKQNTRITVVDSKCGDIRIDASQMKQVLINLVQNAAESMGHDGTITLRARGETKRLAHGKLDAIILEVIDTGKGIPSEVQKRLFDPFFSTKDTGTGLGLPIAARIVEKHGGALQYQTEVNHGTTFGIVLPRA